MLLNDRLPQLAEPIINGKGVVSPSNALSYGYYGTTYHSLNEQAGGGLEFMSGPQGFAYANGNIQSGNMNYYSAFESILEPETEFQSYHYMYNLPNGRTEKEQYSKHLNGQSELNSPYAIYNNEIYSNENGLEGAVDNWRIFNSENTPTVGLQTEAVVDDINSYQLFSPTDYSTLGLNNPWTMNVKVLYENANGYPTLVRTVAFFDRNETLNLDGYHWDYLAGSLFPQALPLYSQFGLPVANNQYWEYTPKEAAQAYFQSGGKYETLVHSFTNGLVEPKKQLRGNIADSYEFMNEMLKYNDTERREKTVGTPLNAGLGDATTFQMRQGDFLSEPAGLIYQGKSQYTNNGFFNDAVYSPFYYTDAATAPNEVRPTNLPDQAGQSKANGRGVDGHLEESPTHLGRVWKSFDSTLSYGGLETEEDELGVPAYASYEAYIKAVRPRMGWEVIDMREDCLVIFDSNLLKISGRIYRMVFFLFSFCVSCSKFG